jgi:hypothetical protein
MDRDSTFYRKPLGEHDLTGLMELCANVARNVSANSKQSDTAHALRMEWVQLDLKHLLDGGHTEAEKSLRKRMIEFLAEVPSWMLSGA